MTWRPASPCKRCWVRRNWRSPADATPPIYVSGFGPKAIDLAARIGDGFVTVGPDAESVQRFRSQAKDGALVQGGLKVCWDGDEAKARKTAYRLWPNEQLPGELAQVLPTPAHFEQASELVSEDMVAETVPCGPDLDRHMQTLQEYADAGVDELFVQQIGPNQDEFFDTWARELVPRFNPDPA